MTDTHDAPGSSRQTQLSVLKEIASTLERESLANKGLFIIALVFFLYFAQLLLLPIFFAFLLYFLFIPLVNILDRCYIPKPVGAALVIFLLFVLLGFGFYTLSSQANAWLRGSPDLFNALSLKLSRLAAVSTEYLGVSWQSSTNLEDVISLIKNIPKEFLEAIFNTTKNFLIGLGLSLALLYFLLAAETSYLYMLLKNSLTLKKRHEDVALMQRIERNVWRYLFSRTMINIAVAILVGGFLAALRVPYPLLWGVIIGMLEYIPFIGAVISCVIMAVISIVTFEELGPMLLMPISFAVFLAVEGNIIAPYIFGRQMVLNNVTTVLGIFFFSWAWGFLGPLLAVPLLMTIRIILRSIDEDHFGVKVLDDSAESTQKLH